jgi:uncharacterized membrane protein
VFRYLYKSSRRLVIYIRVVDVTVQNALQSDGIQMLVHSVKFVDIIEYVISREVQLFSLLLSLITESSCNLSFSLRMIPCL